MPRTPLGLLSPTNGTTRPVHKIHTPSTEYSNDKSGQPDIQAAIHAAIDAAINAPESALAHARATLPPPRRCRPPLPPSVGTLQFYDSNGTHSIELLREIGEGGFGTVYLAKSSRFQQRLACKMVGHGGDPDEMADIAREVAVHAHLSSSA